MSLRVILLVAAVVCFIIGFIIAAGWVTGIDVLVLTCLGLACFAGAHLT